jgi:hypothetical protein
MAERCDGSGNLVGIANSVGEQFALFLLTIALMASPLSATCKPFVQDNQQKMSCEVDSGLVSGGKGDNWGHWYTIRIPIPDGYTVESISFRLQGPHPCAADFTYPAPLPADNPVAQLNKTIEAIQRSVFGGVNFPPLLNPDAPLAAGKGVGSWAECEESGDPRISWGFHFKGWTEETRVVEYSKEGLKLSWPSKNVAIKQKATLLAILVQIKK